MKMKKLLALKIMILVILAAIATVAIVYGVNTKRCKKKAAAELLECDDLDCDCDEDDDF